MIKPDAIGIIETQYFTVAMEMLDHVCKTAQVELLSSEKYLGGRLVSLIIGGSVADVTEAIRTAEALGQTKTNRPLKKALIITNPHEEILRFIISPKQKKVQKGKTTTKNNNQTKGDNKNE